jgi:hypothetical protein
MVMKIVFLYVLLALLHISCKNESMENYVITQPNNDTIKIKNFVLNIHQALNNRYVENVYIELENYNKLDKTIIENMNLVLNDSLFTLEGMIAMYSSVYPTSDFIFFQDNNTFFVSANTLQSRKMFMIWPGTKPIENIINAGIELDTIRTFSDKLTPEVFLEDPHNNN